MSSRFVLANIKMPIEITHDNKIKPMQHLSNIYVVSIIDSINDITIDRSLPDVITQSNMLFQSRVVESSRVETVIPSSPTMMEDDEQEQEPPSIHNIIPSSPFQLWIRPDELHKTPKPFKQNTTFKNHGKYSHRATAKYRAKL